MVLFHLTVSQN